MSKLTENEKSLAGHITRFGSAGYPVQKRGRNWWWISAFGVGGCPVPFKTKRAAVAAFEKWMDLYRERAGQEAYERALGELQARAQHQANTLGETVELTNSGVTVIAHPVTP